MNFNYSTFFFVHRISEIMMENEDINENIEKEKEKVHSVYKKLVDNFDRFFKSVQGELDELKVAYKQLRNRRTADHYGQRSTEIF